MQKRISFYPPETARPKACYSCFSTQNPKPYGLHNFSETVPTTPGRYAPGQPLGQRYVYVKNKNKGVEPGFQARKHWTLSDERKRLDPNHKFFHQARAFIDQYQRDQQALPTEDQVRQHLQALNPKFQKIHFIKLDYADPKRKGGKVYLGARAKNWIHNLWTAARPQHKNFLAVKECLVNELLDLMAIQTPKTKLIHSRYQDGTSKILIDSTEVMGPHREPFHDYKDDLKDGILPDNKAGGAPIEPLGRYLIPMLVIADRDAVGTDGSNIGYVVNTKTRQAEFWKIDVGKALPPRPNSPLETDLMRFINVHADASYDQPVRPIDWMTKGYRNFSVFEDCPLSEKIRGVRLLKNLAETGADLALFDAYAQYFDQDGRQHPELNFGDKIRELKQLYHYRRDAVLAEFRERLPLTAVQLDTLDHLEKLTSRTTEISETGKYPLQHLKTVRRQPWSVTVSEAGCLFKMKPRFPWSFNRVKRRLSRFFQGNAALSARIKAAESGVIFIPRNEFDAFSAQLSESAVRDFKRREAEQSFWYRLRHFSHANLIKFQFARKIKLPEVAAPAHFSPKMPGD